MADVYRFDYGPHTIYETVVGLLRDHHGRDGEVVVDLGCGFGAIAEPVRDQLGLVYLGVDIEETGLKDLAERGFETAQVDLAEPDGAVAVLRDLLAGRSLAAVCGLDFIEHTVNPDEVLRALHVFAVEHGNAPLLLSVPNVTHFDVAAKALMGRWDVTPTGLLDVTHVSLFSPGRLDAITRANGWVEVAADDFEMVHSDQHFPADAAPLVPGTPLRNLLARVRDQAAEGADVVGFVRVYAPAQLVDPAPGPAAGPGPEPFLSVLVRTQGRRESTLEETLLSLAAQTSQDFEVLLLVHSAPREQIGRFHAMVGRFDTSFSARVRIITVEGGGRARPLNVGARQARGRYLVALDDDDIAFGHWVESFERLAASHPGRVLRSVVAEQPVEADRWGERPAYHPTGRPECSWPVRFDLLQHLVDNYSPFCGFAIPRACFSELGFAFDEDLTVCEDWDVLMQAAMWCGVVDSEEVTSLYRRWQTEDSSLHHHSELEWKQARNQVLAKLDRQTLLFPPDSMTALHQLQEAVKTLHLQVNHYRLESNHYQAALAAAEAERRSRPEPTGRWYARRARALGARLNARLRRG